MMSVPFAKKKIRSDLRSIRGTFLGSERKKSEQKINQQIQNVLSKYPFGRIGVYLPFDGEVDISFLWGGGLPTKAQMASNTLSSRFVFPIHEKGKELRFVEPEVWNQSQSLPMATGPVISLSELRVMLVPGVAFCPKTGMRVGLGGGHYDRTLSLREENAWRLDAFGVGFSFQQRPDIPRDPWDIPLDGLICESGIRVFTELSSWTLSRESEQ